jgi:uncharacterized membrane protein YhhN
MLFPGGLAAAPNAALVFSVAAAFLYLLMLDQPPSWRRTAAKTLAVLLLAFLAFDQNGPMLLVAALLFSAAGDALLAQEGEKTFLAGLASFLLAHILYIALFATAGEGASIFAEPWRMAAALLMATFVAALLHRLWPRLDTALRASVAVYSAAILLMGFSALTLPVPPVVLGAALFILSDGLLAANRFLLPAGSPYRAWRGKAVWLLYYAAQVAITLGVLTA